MINNDTSETAKSSLREGRIETLRKKDFTNPKTLIEWLVLAREVVEENSQFIINKTGDIGKFQEENDFIYEVLGSLHPLLFLAERMEEAQRSGNVEEQNVINELQLALTGKKSEIEEIKKIIEEAKVSDNISKDKKRNSIVLDLKADLKKKKRESQIINNSQVMKSNKEVIENVRKFLVFSKEKLDKDAEAGVLSQRVEQVLQQDDEGLKTECEKLCQELDDGKYESISNLVGCLNKVWLSYYLDKWFAEEESKLNEEQKKKIEDFDKLEQERGELQQKVEELEKQGGVGVDDDAKNKLEKLIDDLLTNYSINDNELTDFLALKGETWRTLLSKSDTPYDLAHLYGKIVESADQINEKKEKEKLEKEISEWKRKEKEWELKLEQKDEEIEKKNQEIEEALKAPTVPPTPKTPAKETKLAQKWLEDNYEGDKGDVDEISVNESEGPILTGDLKIKDYPELTSITLLEMGITKLIIENCRKVEEIDVYGNEITEITGLENLPELRTLICANNQLNKIDVSNNLQLSQLEVFDNPGIQVNGLKNLSTLTGFKSDDNEPINMVKIIGEEWGEAAKKLGIDEKELENKSPEEIKELIQKEGDIVRENEAKINNPDIGLPGLLKDRKIDDDELTKVKQKLSEVDKLKEDLEKSDKEKIQAKKGEKEALEKLKTEKEKNQQNKKLLQVYEVKVKKSMSESDFKKLKEKTKKSVEAQEAKIEVDANK